MTLFLYVTVEKARGKFQGCKSDCWKSGKSMVGFPKPSPMYYHSHPHTFEHDHEHTHHGDGSAHADKHELNGSTPHQHDHADHDKEAQDHKALVNHSTHPVIGSN
jgi:hypothetical protein